MFFFFRFLLLQLISFLRHEMAFKFVVINPYVFVQWTFLFVCSYSESWHASLQLYLCICIQSTAKERQSATSKRTFVCRWPMQDNGWGITVFLFLSRRRAINATRCSDRRFSGDLIHNEGLECSEGLAWLILLALHKWLSCLVEKPNTESLLYREPWVEIPIVL